MEVRLKNASLARSESLRFQLEWRGGAAWKDSTLVRVDVAARDVANLVKRLTFAGASTPVDCKFSSTSRARKPLCPPFSCILLLYTLHCNFNIRSPLSPALHPAIETNIIQQSHPSPPCRAQHTLSISPSMLSQPHLSVAPFAHGSSIHLSTTLLQELTICIRSEDASCFAPQDPAEAAALSSQRLDSFMADDPPFYTRGVTVSSARKAMKQTMKDFDSAFEDATDKS